MTDITIPPEALEKAARAIIIKNGGNPDELLRLTIHKTTIKAWEQVLPLAESACLAMLEAWPGMAVYDGCPVWHAYPHIILPLPQEPTND